MGALVDVAASERFRALSGSVADGWHPAHASAQQDQAMAARRKQNMQVVSGIGSAKLTLGRGHPHGVALGPTEK